MAHKTTTAQYAAVEDEIINASNLIAAMFRKTLKIRGNILLFNIHATTAVCNVESDMSMSSDVAVVCGPVLAGC